MDASDVIPIVGVLESLAFWSGLRRRATASSCEVCQVKDLDDPALAAAWDALERTGSCSAFQTRAFVCTFFDTVGRALRAKPVVIVVRDRHLDVPALILPLMLRERAGVPVIEAVDAGLADYTVPILRADAQFDRVAMQALWPAILAALPPSAVLHLKKVPESLSGRANPLALVPGMRPMGTSSHALAITPEAVKPSRNTREQFRRLGKLEGFEHVVAQNPREAEEMLAAAIEQRRLRAAQQGMASHLDAPGVADFYRALAREGLAEGSVCVHGFRIGGQWAAINLSLVRGGRFNAVILTHDDRHANLMLGYSLLFRGLEWAQARGLTVFDLGVGEFAYKKRFEGEPVKLREYVRLRRPSGALVWADAAGRRALRASVKRHAWLRRLLRPWLGANFGG